MKKYIHFPLWKIEKLEQSLEKMEKSGYRLTNVSYSHWFTFKESPPKEMYYFLSYKAFRGQSMGNCDYALESKHKANLIDSQMCYYSLYRTKEQKDELSLLFEVRMDYIKRILFEKAVTSLFLAIIFALLLYATMSASANYKSLLIMIILLCACVFLTTYYFYGFSKQRSKCKKYEQNNYSNR